MFLFLIITCSYIDAVLHLAMFGTARCLKNDNLFGCCNHFNTYYIILVNVLKWISQYYHNFLRSIAQWNKCLSCCRFSHIMRKMQHKNIALQNTLFTKLWLSKQPTTLQQQQVSFKQNIVLKAKTIRMVVSGRPSVFYHQMCPVNVLNHGAMYHSTLVNLEQYSPANRRDN